MVKYVKRSKIFWWLFRSEISQTLPVPAPEGSGLVLTDEEKNIIIDEIEKIRSLAIRAVGNGLTENKRVLSEWLYHILNFLRKAERCIHEKDLLNAKYFVAMAEATYLREINPTRPIWSFKNINAYHLLPYVPIFLVLIIAF